MKDLFNWYVKYHENWKPEFSLYPWSNIKNSLQGYTALACFHQLESLGKNLPCIEPLLLYKAMNGKSLINWQIKQWCESIKEGTPG